MHRISKGSASFRAWHFFCRGASNYDKDTVRTSSHGRDLEVMIHKFFRGELPQHMQMHVM